MPENVSYTRAQFLAFLLLQKFYYFPQYLPVLCHSRWSFRWQGKKSEKTPLIRNSKSKPQICIQVVKRNVLIAGKCCTHRSTYFSIIFLYRDFVTKRVCEFGRLLHQQRDFRKSVQNRKFYIFIMEVMFRKRFVLEIKKTQTNKIFIASKYNLNTYFGVLWINFIKIVFFFQPI